MEPVESTEWQEGVVAVVESAEDKFAAASFLVHLAHKTLHSMPPCKEKEAAAPHLNVACTYFLTPDVLVPKPAPVVEETTESVETPAEEPKKAKAKK